MLNFLGLTIGVLTGVIWARRRGGNRLDMAHYATVLGMIGFVLGMFAMLVLPAPV
ncbi:MAG: hypothetical protein ACI8TF_003039 [Paracoccaceae bacterium]|jgi:hypothetical protein